MNMSVGIAVVACILSSLTWAAPRPPNVVLLLADDLGYADVGFQGMTDIPTPAIDQVAAQGARFTDGYATHPVCSPSRAGLLTGLYQHRFGFEHNSGPERFTAPNFGVPRTVPMLAEKLAAAGYATGMVGKWHVGFQPGLRPHERGFGYHYGFLAGASDYLRAGSLLRNGEPVPASGYLTDVFGDEAVSFIEGHRSQPFFLYGVQCRARPLQSTDADSAAFATLADPRRRTYAGMPCHGCGRSHPRGAPRS
jgi:arylsulfatase A-like enzyme